MTKKKKTLFLDNGLFLGLGVVTASLAITWWEDEARRKNFYDSTASTHPFYKKMASEAVRKPAPKSESRVDVTRPTPKLSPEDLDLTGLIPPDGVKWNWEIAAMNRPDLPIEMWKRTYVLRSLVHPRDFEDLNRLLHAKLEFPALQAVYQGLVGLMEQGHEGASDIVLEDLVTAQTRPESLTDDRYMLVLNAGVDLFWEQSAYLASLGDLVLKTTPEKSRYTVLSLMAIQREHPESDFSYVADRLVEALYLEDRTAVAAVELLGRLGRLPEIRKTLRTDGLSPSVRGALWLRAASQKEERK